MRRLAAVCITLYILFLMTGCAATTSDDPDRIDQPANNKVLLDGTWKITERLGREIEEPEQVNSADLIIGENVGFSKQTIVFGGNYFSDISYKVRRVSIREYFLHKKIDVLEKLGDIGDEALVFTAYSKDKYLYEFLRLTDDKVLVNINDLYYSLERSSDEFIGIGDAMAGTLTPSDLRNTNARDQSVSSGILLGIRTPIKTEDGIGDYTYRTYWISAKNRIFRPVLTAGDIYLPRMDGFWKLKIDKKMGNEGTEDILTAAAVSKKGETLVSQTAQNYSTRVETKLRRAIVYVGNDYVCIENTEMDSLQNSPVLRKTLRTLPVDNIENREGIKISDLAGENGTLAMESAMNDLLKGADNNGIMNIDEASMQESFALYRKMGHWFFKGRLNLGTSVQLPYMDFNLNLIPPANMVAYDMLQVPWTEIKDKLPQAVDVYTSPNRDIAVVLTRNTILLYTISGNSLSEQPSMKLPLPDGSSVIMAEWAVGNYMLSWERSFVKNNETVLEAGIK